MCVAFHIVSVGDFILILEDECNSRQLCWCPDYGLDRDGWRSLEGPTTHLQCLAMQQAQLCSVLGHLLKGLEGFKLMTTVYQYISEKSIHIYLYIYIYTRSSDKNTNSWGVLYTWFAFGNPRVANQQVHHWFRSVDGRKPPFISLFTMGSVHPGAIFFVRMSAYSISMSTPPTPRPIQLASGKSIWPQLQQCDHRSAGGWVGLDEGLPEIVYSMTLVSWLWWFQCRKINTERDPADIRSW